VRVVSGHDREAVPPREEAPVRRVAPPTSAVLAMQRSVGNAAVARYLSSRRLQREITWMDKDTLVTLSTDDAFDKVKGAGQLKAISEQLGTEFKSFVALFDNRDFANRNKFIDEIKKEYERVRKMKQEAWGGMQPADRLKELESEVAKAGAKQGDETLRRHKIILAEATATWGGQGAPRAILGALLTDKDVENALYKLGLQRRFAGAGPMIAQLYRLLIALADPKRVVKADLADKLKHDLGFWKEIEKPTQTNELIVGFTTTLAGLVGELSGLDFAEQTAAVAAPGVHSGWRLEDPASAVKYSLESEEKKQQRRAKKAEKTQAKTPSTEQAPSTEPQPSTEKDTGQVTAQEVPKQFREEVLEEDVDIVWLDDDGVLHMMESAKDLDALSNKISGANLAEAKLREGLVDPSQKQRYQALLIRAQEGAVRWGPAKGPEPETGSKKGEKKEKKKPETTALMPKTVRWYYNIPEREMVTLRPEEFSVLGRVQSIGVSLVVGRTLYTPTTLNQLLEDWRAKNTVKKEEAVTTGASTD
jgi:hypothetical protein